MENTSEEFLSGLIRRRIAAADLGLVSPRSIPITVGSVRARHCGRSKGSAQSSIDCATVPKRLISSIDNICRNATLCLDANVKE